MFAKSDASKDAIAHTVVTTSGTVTLSYPEGRNAASYGTDGDHVITGRDFSELSSKLGHITLTFGPSDITVVNNTERQFKAGTAITASLDVSGYDGWADRAVAGVVKLSTVEIALGTPATADADGAVASQAATLASGLATGINGALAASSIATFDVPRNVVAAWTTTAILTVTGTDLYGNVVVESSASGTSLTGKKAFKTITAVTTSADITGLTVGSGVVLGLPIYLDTPNGILAETVDGANASAGTKVAGVTATATATTGDVRGTVSPSSAPNGSRSYTVIAAVRSASYKGIAQFAG